MKRLALFLGAIYLIGILGCGSDEGNGGTDGEKKGDGEKKKSSNYRLPESAFIYLKMTKGGERSLHAYDTATKKSWMIKSFQKLDQKYQKIGSRNIQLALSPDRKWIALMLFNPDKKDLDSGFLTRGIWKLSADGKEMIRLSEPVVNPHQTNCQSDADCYQNPTGNYCHPIRKKCEKKNFDIKLNGTIAWSADGKEIWFALAQSWTSSNGKLVLSSWLASVSSEGGPIKLHNSGAGCYVTQNPSPHPKKPLLVALRFICANFENNIDGIYAYDIPIQKPKLLIKFDGNLKAEGGTAGKLIWTKAGDGFFFAAATVWDLNGDGQAETKGQGLLAFDAVNGKLYGVIPPQRDRLIASYDISPDEKEIVYSIIRRDRNSPTAIYIFNPKQKKNIEIIKSSADEAIGSVDW